MELAQVVGDNVYRLRTATRVSLADLATAAGMSKTTLHGIEQGQGNPTLATLWALATAMSVSLGELLEPPAPSVEVIRAADDRPRIEGEAVTARLLHRIRLRGAVEIYDIDIAGTTQRSDAHQPGVQEYILLTQGRVSVGPVDSPVELAPGDCVRFDGDRPHAYRGVARRSRAILLMLHPDP